MMNRCRSAYRRIKALKWLSPGSFLLCAATFSALFLVMHLAGWRDRTSIFCGTLPQETKAQVTQRFQAVSYTLFYMATVIVAPILVLAAAVYRGLMMFCRRGR